MSATVTIKQSYDLVVVWLLGSTLVVIVFLLLVAQSCSFRNYFEYHFFPYPIPILAFTRW